MRFELLACVFFIIISIVAVSLWQERESVYERSLDQNTSHNAGQTTTQNSTRTKSKKIRRDYYAREVRIPAARNAHYYVDARVNRRSLKFLIDTGATFVAIRESDARRAGILLGESDYTVPISTANGKALAARVSLDLVDVDGLEVSNVDAFVMPDRQLNVNLLGMSYLSKLSGFQTRDGELILKG